MLPESDATSCCDGGASGDVIPYDILSVGGCTWSYQDVAATGASCDQRPSTGGRNEACRGKPSCCLPGDRQDGLRACHLLTHTCVSKTPESSLRHLPNNPSAQARDRLSVGLAEMASQPCPLAAHKTYSSST